LERFLELDELFVQVLESRARVGVLEPRGGRTALDLPGVDQGGQVARNIMENSLPALLLTLEALPILAHATGSPGLDLAEDMGMASDELCMGPAGNLLEIACAALVQEQREEVDLEEQVAELIEQLGVVALLGRVRYLIGLLDGMRHDRACRLLAIPGTISPQPLCELLELEQRGGETQISRWWSVPPKRGARSRPDTSSASRSSSSCRSTTS